MSRLSRYLIRQYAAHGLALLGAVVFLVWITQALRLFDLITAKGQDLFTLAGQSLLTTPPLARATIYICIAIGIVRTLKAMQVSRELHSIHAGRRIGALWSSLIATALAGALAVGVVSHWAEPASRNAYNDWSARIAADLVGRTLEPHRFREITPDFVVEIGGRRSDGTITDFFAHDARDPEATKTYQARSATIASDKEGLYLALTDGVLQYYRSDGTFSEVRFAGYQLGLDKLAREATPRSQLEETTSLTLLADAQTRALSPVEIGELQSRSMESLRVLAMCLLVGAIAGFPTARRGRTYLPLEVTVVSLAMVDRVMTDFLPLPAVKGATGVLMLFAIGLVVMVWRLGNFHLPRFGKVAA